MSCATVKEFYVPKTLDEAIRLKNEKSNSFFIAGGTEINSRPFGREAAAGSGYTLISLAGLGINDISRDEDGNIVIGAMATLQQIVDCATLREAGLEVIQRAARNVTNRNIRNMATLGGNIASNKSCSDLIPVLIACRAKLQIYAGEARSELVPVENWSNGLITAVVIPPPGNNYFIGLRRFARTSNDLALINMAVGLEIVSGEVKFARFAIGGVAKNVRRLTAVEEALNGRKIEKLLSAEINAVLQKNIDPIDDIRGSSQWKRTIAEILLTEIIEEMSKRKETRNG